jgi:apolipoprotein N-acyltransferase
METAQTIRRPGARPSPAREQQATDLPAPWWRSTLALALLGNLLLWAALPPLSLALVAWLAPVPWVMLIQGRTLTGKRPYAALWLAAFVFWLAVLYWVTLPHWATTFGWLAVSCYLAFYFVAFVGLARVAVHALGVTPILAAPVVWTGLELARAHFLGGFAMASLSHTQYRWPAVIQISDLFGGYGVSFVIVLVGACLARMLRRADGPRAWWPVVPLAIVPAAAFAYGHWRTGEQTTEPGPKVALIQGSIDVDMKYDPTQAQRIFDEYYNLSLRAVDKDRDLDLIVWPETMFRDPWYTFDKDFRPPSDVRWTPEEAEARSRLGIEATVSRLRVPCLLGVDTVHYKPGRIDYFNTALLVDREGHVEGRYDKCHLVPFGEYVPLAETFPWLYKLTPLPGSSNAGTGPRAFQVGQACAATNICYENTLPHFIRDQLLQLRAGGHDPDILINLTNDGWFWGSSELDLHLACAVFRAVECRKPFLIAANTGFSAWIDSNGRIVAEGPRRATDVIVATPRIDHRASWYLEHGDLLAALCLLATGAVALVGLRQRRFGRAARFTPKG